MPRLLCLNDLALCGEAEEDMKLIVGRFIELCSIRGLKVSLVKSKVNVLGGRRE